MRKIVTTFLAVAILALAVNASVAANGLDKLTNIIASLKNAVSKLKDPDKNQAVVISIVKEVKKVPPGQVSAAVEKFKDLIDFQWDWKQLNSGYLCVAKELFDYVDSFEVLCDESNNTVSVTICVDDAKYLNKDGCYVFAIPKFMNNKNLKNVRFEFVENVYTLDLIGFFPGENDGETFVWNSNFIDGSTEVELNSNVDWEWVKETYLANLAKFAPEFQNAVVAWDFYDWKTGGISHGTSTNHLGPDIPLVKDLFYKEELGKYRLFLRPEYIARTYFIDLVGYFPGVDDEGNAYTWTNNSFAMTEVMLGADVDWKWVFNNYKANFDSFAPDFQYALENREIEYWMTGGITHGTSMDHDADGLPKITYAPNLFFQPDEDVEVYVVYLAPMYTPHEDPPPVSVDVIFQAHLRGENGPWWGKLFGITLTGDDAIDWDWVIEQYAELDYPIDLVNFDHWKTSCGGVAGLDLTWADVVTADMLIDHFEIQTTASQGKNTVTIRPIVNDPPPQDLVYLGFLCDDAGGTPNVIYYAYETVVFGEEYLTDEAWWDAVYEAYDAKGGVAEEEILGWKANSPIGNDYNFPHRPDSLTLSDDMLDGYNLNQDPAVYVIWLEPVLKEEVVDQIVKKIGFTGYYESKKEDGKIMKKIFYYQKLMDVDFLDWDAIDAAYDKWVAKGGLEPDRSEWNATGAATFTFADYDVIGFDRFTDDPDSTCYKAYYVDPGYIPPPDPINLGFIGYYFNEGNVLQTSFYWQELKEGETLDWDAIDAAYDEWVAGGGLAPKREVWQTSGPKSFTFDDYAAIGFGDFTEDQLEQFYGAFYVDPGYILPPDPINLGFIGYYVYEGNVLSTSIYWQELKEGETLDWDAIDAAYDEWVAKGGLEPKREVWQTSGPASFTFEDYAEIGFGDFTEGQLEQFYGAFYLDPGYILPDPPKPTVNLSFNAWLDDAWWYGLEYFETHELGIEITPDWDAVYNAYATQANVTPGWFKANKVLGWQSSGIVSQYFEGATPTIILTEEMYEQYCASDDVLVIVLDPVFEEDVDPTVVNLSFYAFLDNSWWYGLNYAEERELGTNVTPDWDAVYEAYATQANVTPGWFKADKVIGWQSSGIVSQYFEGARPDVFLTEELIEQYTAIVGGVVVIVLDPVFEEEPACPKVTVNFNGLENQVTFKFYNILQGSWETVYRTEPGESPLDSYEFTLPGAGSYIFQVINNDFGNSAASAFTTDVILLADGDNFELTVPVATIKVDLEAVEDLYKIGVAQNDWIYRWSNYVVGGGKDTFKVIANGKDYKVSNVDAKSVLTNIATVTTTFGVCEEFSVPFP